MFPLIPKFLSQSRITILTAHYTVCPSSPNTEFMAEDNVSTHVLEIYYPVENQLYAPFLCGSEALGVAERNGVT